MKEIIIAKLREIEAQENVKIIFAVESGSRAWGFESPDSDYDVRFVYLRNRRDYLKLEPIRDVIEWQLDDTLDINGWDLQKALRLTHNGNPVFFEWLNSPVRYYADEELFPQLKAACEQYFSPKKALYHYWHMCDKNFKDYLQGDQVKLKKYFYALRPIWAAQWIRERGTIPPVLFDELRKDMCPPALKPAIESLLAMKVKAGEAERIEPVTILNEYIQEGLVEMKATLQTIEEEQPSWALLDEFFLKIILDPQQAD